ncbi:hypothetical protein NW801_22135 [Brevibacillus laterosporus]|uniref:Uncharacterized protein n=1 Tax=Brevibacillus halotolerans TaxID=1507437 RepID=A0ABT4I4F9_9BACL|nr:MULTISPECIES: hypothetical protein [Brevibacillus]MCR8987693.1 hypothetical protein [Brevibacillus laterosporus]MCZ0833432.1 hypothetical protein [Brevibacillus halotolerans]
MARTVYKPGDLFVMRTRKGEDPLILQWGAEQDNLGDAIRYLIEQEIRANGVRNLAEHISSKRPSLQPSPTLAVANGPIGIIQESNSTQQQPVISQPVQYVAQEAKASDEIVGKKEQNVSLSNEEKVKDAVPRVSRPKARNGLQNKSNKWSPESWK